MREFLKSRGSWVRVGWLLPLLLLALPNCADVIGIDDWTAGGSGGSGGGDGSNNSFDPGSDPTSAVMCDIPVAMNTQFDPCAVTDTDVMNSMRMAAAAVALVQDNGGNAFVIDYSKAAFDECGGPKKYQFWDAFPQGSKICLNCGTQKPVPYADGNAVCFTKCVDLNHLAGQFDGQPGGDEAFCEAAHVSTNFDKQGCFTGACDAGGSYNPNFHDPRTDQEKVIWIPQNGATASGNDLWRTAGPSGNFDAGGFSTQCVQHGDAWVDFEVSGANAGYAVGFSEHPADQETLQDVPFALVLNQDSTLAIHQFGVPVAENLGSYTPGQRFRVKVTQNDDGSDTATLSAAQLDCPPQSTCVETKQLGPSSTTSPHYKLWVDASLMDQGPILGSVTMVSIQRDPTTDPSNCVP